MYSLILSAYNMLTYKKKQELFTDFNTKVDLLCAGVCLECIWKTWRCSYCFIVSKKKEGEATVADMESQSHDTLYIYN